MLQMEIPEVAPKEHRTKELLSIFAKNRTESLKVFDHHGLRPEFAPRISSQWNTPLLLVHGVSQNGVGTVLAQDNDDGLIHPVYFRSKPISKAEKQYHITKKHWL
ncbi:hypothetical protein COOONC_21315 [Cooperia oncophora]